jgi:hypothetical protein
LRAFLWLRWRLLLNQMVKGGIANVIVLLLVGIFFVCLAWGGMVGFFAIGYFALPQVPPDKAPLINLAVWDGLVLLFLFAWATGLVTELQRSEALALDKFLHLPVSLSGVFLINYLSSLLSLNLIVFVPALVALVLGQACAQGTALLVLLPLLAAFFLAVTAVTYQFQGWLAALMTNKRRRRTVIVVVSFVFILLTQTPNLVNFLQPWRKRGPDASQQRQQQEQAELQRELGAGKITPKEHAERLTQLQEKFAAEEVKREEELLQQISKIAHWVNLLLPPGWLPLGAQSAVAGNLLPALLGTLGLSLIGVASLWRAYRTTLRLYTGHFTSGRRRPAPLAPTGPPPRGFLLEWQLRGLSEQTQAIVLSSLRSLLRAPEVKLMLLGPFIMVVIAASTLLTLDEEVPVMMRPLLACGATLMTLFFQVQLIGNQFGFDRSGFRVFVLSAAPRRDILLGKNLALAPLTLGLVLPVLVVLEVLCPLRFDHLLAVPPQMVSMYLIVCLEANLVSILAPLPIAAGSLRPANAKVLPILVQAFAGLLLPVLLAPTLLPLGIEFVLHHLGWAHGVPIYLLLELLECAVIVYLYRLVVSAEGQLLQAREQKILETVTTKAE